MERLVGTLQSVFSDYRAILSTLAIIVFCSRVLRHPLKKYPGPFIATLTNGYSGYHASKKRLHLATFQDHVKYGPVVRQAPNRLVFNTVTAFQDIYLNPNVHKSTIYELTQFNPEKNIFGTLDRERHRKKRKLYGKILSEKSLRTFAPTMSAEVDIFLRQLLSCKYKAINMSPLCERLTADIAGHLAFGQPLHTQTEATNRLFPRAMTSMNAVVSLFMAWPALSNIWPILRRLNKKNNIAFVGALQRIITARITLPKTAKHDFYSIAIDDQAPEEESLTRTEIWAEAVFFLPAGGTTTSTALSATFFYLSRHPIVYAKLANEIRTTFESGRAIETGPLLSGCRYLRAVIDETLRIAPPFVGTFWREPDQSYKGSFVVDGHVIPPGTIVGVNPYSLMHNEKYFPHPFQFRPERWLDDTEDEEQLGVRALSRRAFIPFAAGETGCLGKNMAYHEASLMVAKTLWYFDFQSPLGEAGQLGEGQPGRTDGRDRKDEYQLYDIATADHDGPNLIFKPREGFCRDLILGTGS
ncbi:hypothetical protein N0V93_002675 [Gnomoniopsis smithogilvyi]|uniref:Cytochrome P450 n=1 Tax=Gnomoniopsis smithogilvyi TaxID=1191159 RepID=A0A9W9CZA7_9PEZI|nr:hypothetical protein N0V93_002675 [Gnomoniopsis smithogilvyi]